MEEIKPIPPLEEPIKSKMKSIQTVKYLDSLFSEEWKDNYFKK